MKKLSFLLSFILLFSLVSPVSAGDLGLNEKKSDPQYVSKQDNSEIVHPIGERWMITFSMAVDHSSANESTIYVTDENGEKVDASLSITANRVIVFPPSGSYKPGKYVLHIEKGVQSISGEFLEAGQTKAFTIAYDVW